MKNIICFIVSILLLSQVTLRAQNAVLNEKMFVHTDKNYYHVGEILWFKAYVVDGSLHKPLDLSKVAYAELLSADNTPALQGKILLADGSGSGSFIIPAELPSGIYLFRAYTSWMKNFPPEYYFHKEITIVNPFSGGKVLPVVSVESPGITDKEYQDKQLQISILPDKTEYGTRKKINIQLMSTDGGVNPLPAGLSVSVYRLDSLIKADPSDISRSVLELGAAPRPSSFTYSPEYSGHIITGKVVNSSGLPVANVPAYLFSPGGRTMFYNSVSDASGNVQFDAKNLWGTDEVIVQTNPLADSTFRIQLNSPFSKNFSSKKPVPFNLQNAYAVTLLDQSINTQVQQAYNAEQQMKFMVPAQSDTSAFYGNEYTHYDLDEYVRFTNMEQVFREYVKPVGVSKRGNMFHTFIYDEITRKPLENDPLVLIDGIPVFKMNKLMSYDPLKVKTVDIVARKYYRGRSLYDGIVDISTYFGDLAGYQLDGNATVVKYDGLQDHRQFYSPSYATPQEIASRLPDFRTVLYWSPEITTGADGKKNIEFYSSDLEGKYVIIVQGNNPAGWMGSKMATFEVKAGK